MIVLYLLALLWVAFVFAVCVGDFFEVEFRSLGVGFITDTTAQKLATMKKAA